MKTNKFGEIVYNEHDVCNIIMQGHDIFKLEHLTVDPDLNIERVASLLEDPSSMLTWKFPTDSDISVPEFDHVRQSQWFMPNEYKHIDIAEHVL